MSRWLPAAAALLLAAGAAWWGWRPAPVAPPTSHVASAPPAAPASAPPVAPAAATPSAAQVAIAAPPGEGGLAAIGKPSAARRPPRAVRPKAPIEAVGFVPIPSAAGLPAFESGEIVRLGIPVTALPNFGVDISSGGQVSVQADLLIGQDGQARAIRLVTASSGAPRPRQ